MEADYSMWQNMWNSGASNRAITSPYAIKGQIDKVLIDVGNYANAGSINIWTSGAIGVKPVTENVLCVLNVGNTIGSILRPVAATHSIDGGSVVANEYKPIYVDSHLTVTLSGVGASKSGTFAVYYKS